MERRVLYGFSVEIYMLTHDLIDDYLAKFSPKVREILHVQDIQYEHEYVMAQLRQPKPFFYLIADKHSHEIMGSIEIRNPGYRCQLYCWIHEQYWGQGFFQEAMQLASNDYFNQTDAETIYARIDIDNKRSYYALQKVGFVEVAQKMGPHGLQYEMVMRKPVSAQ